MHEHTSDTDGSPSLPPPPRPPPPPPPYEPRSFAWRSPAFFFSPFLSISLVDCPRVCTCIYIHVYIYICVCVYARVRACVCARVYIFLFIYLFLFISLFNLHTRVYRYRSSVEFAHRTISDKRRGCVRVRQDAEANRCRLCDYEEHAGCSGLTAGSRVGPLLGKFVRNVKYY